MAKFLFFESAVMELIVENGATSGGAAVQTLVWMEGLYYLGHKVSLASFQNERRKVKEEYKFIQIIPIHNSEKGLKIMRWATHILPGTYESLKYYNLDFFMTKFQSC